MTLNDWAQKSVLHESDVVLQIPNNGQWTDYSSNWGSAKQQTKLWYAAISDWEGNTHYKYPALPKIEVELVMYNYNSHFSQEDMGILPFTLVMLVLFVIYLCKSSFEYMNDFRENGNVSIFIKCYPMKTSLNIFHFNREHSNICFEDI